MCVPSIFNTTSSSIIYNLRNKGLDLYLRVQRAVFTSRAKTPPNQPSSTTSACPPSTLLSCAVNHWLGTSPGLTNTPTLFTVILRFEVPPIPAQHVTHILVQNPRP
ncbi:hypothetical protein FRC03_007288 [Tulasnella sp. 419]|nr:hypothetical protein FRC03_007288 [Tulasnella sp. 419]